MWHYCVFEGPAELNIACAVCFQHPAQQSMHCWYWCRKLRRAKPRIYFVCLCFWNGHRTCIIWTFVFEGPAQNSIAFTVSWDSEGKISVPLLRFRSILFCRAHVCWCSRAQPSIFQLSRAKVLSLVNFQALSSIFPRVVELSRAYFRWMELKS